MNGKELQAARKRLMLDVGEAAEHIGTVSVRTWQYWESGRNNVPEDAGSAIQDLLRMRSEMIAEIREASTGDGMTLRYFNAFAEFVNAHPDGTVLGWRLHQSVAAHYYAAGDADLA